MTELNTSCCTEFGPMTKAVVDVERRLMVVDAELYMLHPTKQRESA